MIKDESETLLNYVAMGVKNIWLIDPAHRSAFTFDAGGLHQAHATKLTAPGTPIFVDLADAFAELD